MLHTKKATLEWDSTNEAGQALTAVVMGGESRSMSQQE